jgi:transcriptional antiterminator NusG
LSKSRGNRTRFRTDEARWINPDLTWVVLRCKPSRDTKAVEYLEKAGVDVWMPAYRVMMVRRGKKVEHVRRFFASYLFAGLGKDRNGEVAYGPIYDREFLLGALGEKGPTHFPASLLQHLADRLSGQDKDETERGKRKEAAAKFEAGEFYRATGGPFNGFLAEVTAILECGTIKADVDIFGRKTPVEFEPRWLGAA